MNNNIHEVILIDEQKDLKETIHVSTVESYEFEDTELTGLWVDSDTGKLEVYTKDQPQLTIPKSIAEMLDKEGSYDSAFVYPRTWELEVQGTLESCRRINVQKIYLISKALGVDLVKVVEG